MIDRLAGVGGLLVGLAALAQAIWSARRPPPFEADRVLASAQAELALQVKQQWASEARLHGLTDPSPLQIRWRSTDRPVGAPPDDIGVMPRRDGTVVHIAGTLRHLPARQLVIIGEPGAGKTSLAVILVRELLREPQADEPVPVLLSLSSWDVSGRTLEEWVAGSIARQYPSLTDTERFGNDTAVRLLASGRILPVLDGLDEIHARQRAQAVTRINNYMTIHRPLVLTCRAAEYEDVIGQVGAVLSRAMVVELEPVSGAQVAAYLPGGQEPRSADRWRPVLRELRESPDGVLAQVLATPLMVHLARTAYKQPGSDPSLLLRFDRVRDLEEHLLTAYVPAVYALDDNKPTPWSIDQAQRWLTFLAENMTAHGTREIAWWHLSQAVPRGGVGHVAAGIGAAGGLVFAVMLAMVDLWAGLVVAPMFGLMIGLPLGMVLSLQDGLPQKLRLAPRRFVQGLGVGAALSLTALPLLLLIALAVLTTSGSWSDIPVILFVGITVQLLLCLTFGVLVGVVALLLEGLGGASVGDHLTCPKDVLRRDLLALLVSTSVATAAIGLIVVSVLLPVAHLVGEDTSTFMAITVSAAFALILGPIFGLASGAGSAWLSYQQARIWLCARGNLPWQTIDFLEDAHRRGVLRQIGAEYQFRHVRLQEILSNPRCSSRQRPVRGV